MQDLQAAEKHLSKTLTLNFRDKDLIRAYLGQIYEDKKDYAKAISWYKKVEDGDRYFPSQVRVAALLAKQGDLKGGRDQLHSIKTENDEQKTLIIMADAQILRDAKQFQESIDVLSAGLKELPSSVELLYERAMTAERINKLDVLEADLRKAIELKPDYAHAYNALGYTWAERNIRLQEAAQLIEKAHQLDPNDAAILDSMGWVYYRLGNFDKGVSFLRQALAARPDPEIAAHLAEILLAKGDLNEAKTVSEKALKDNPQTKRY